MDDLVTWWRGVLDERERLAQDVGGDTPEGRWHTGGHDGNRIIDADGTDVAHDECHPTDEQAAHIAANDPASVLAQVAADRKLLDLYRASLEVGERTLWNGGEYARIAALEDVIKVRAEAYSNHPGYREEWRCELP